MTTIQITAIIMLLQAFGVSTSTIALVQTDLSAQQVVIVTTTTPVQQDITPPVQVQQVSTGGPGDESYISTPTLSFAEMPTVSTTTTGQYQLNWNTDIPATVEIRQLIGFTGSWGDIINPQYYPGEMDSSRPYDSVASTTTSYTFNSPIQGFLLVVTSSDRQVIMYRGRLF